jgi:hypothetical protein
MIDSPAGAVTKAELGSTAYSIRKAIQAGELVRMKNGVYIKPENLAVMIPDVEKIVPGGLLCVYSAWSYSGLTTQIPTANFIVPNAVLQKPQSMRQDAIYPTLCGGVYCDSVRKTVFLLYRYR